MSAFVLDQNDINILTQATAAALQLNRKYAASYPLNAETVSLLGKYADDLHSIYRALYIANIKAVNGRYGEDTKTLPRYRSLIPWSIDRLSPDQLERAAGRFGCYLYQCMEDPVYNSPVYNAFTDIYKLVCMIYCKTMINW